MTAEIDDLETRMRQAAKATDFELARSLRDQINLIRGGAPPNEAAAADTGGLTRQQNGSMGLGTSQSKLMPPTGWKPAKKPDLMTSNQSRKRR
ncbi:UvrB/UvrC motif-containing protein [Novosphingobium sp. 9U]|uniref:UvrB/UvrC motif-containing protein n=1 Tax=Novosphingobium sp. 9U TaxID=2653158 RepID=UPI0012F34DA0|nr:UvrB/UvrC motif-containing protein [Novosphingobium sp. 9U]VWX50719.1 Excinuclease ABC subunit B [Novosphingobium sp. 9U]